MTDLLVIGLAAATVGAMWAVTSGRIEGRARAELVAVSRLLLLLAVPVLLVAGSVCAASLLAAKAQSDGVLSLAASLGPAAALYTLALGLVVRLVLAALRCIRAARAALPRAPMRALLPHLSASDRRVVVLPVADPVAYTAGFGRAQVVVSRGLLEILDEDERRALIAHEEAHARAGHQRMLLLGAAVADAFGVLPPVHGAVASLRRAIEAAADDQAVAAVGSRPLVARTIAKAALAAAPTGTPGAAGAELLYRVERLTLPTRCSSAATALVAASGLLLTVALVAAVCVSLHHGLVTPFLGACLAVLAPLALPPLLKARSSDAGAHSGDKAA